MVAQVPEINKILGRDEQVLWKGRPVRFVRIKWRDLFTIPIGVYWIFGSLYVLYVLFALYTGSNIVGASNLNKILPGVSDQWFILSGLTLIPFAMALGINFGFGRLLRDRRTLLNSEYFITNQRIIILIKRRVFMNICRSIPFNQILSILHSENKKGVGTIQITLKLPELSYRKKSVVFFKSKDPSLELVMIGEVKKIKALLDGLLQNDAAEHNAGWFLAT